MPKDTFHNLKTEKKEKLIHAFLREFSIHTYDDASITSVVKLLGIAKGSVYQYFNDKHDLFKYLIEVCAATKLKYVSSIQRESFPDFWHFFRKLYECGYQFDIENPLQSHFLHNLQRSLNAPTTKDFFIQMQKQAIQAFEKMVEHEVSLGLFRTDVSTETMGFMLYKVGVSIMEQLEYNGTIDPQKSIQNKQPVYQGKKEKLLKTVDHYILLAKNAFNKIP